MRSLKTAEIVANHFRLQIVRGELVPGQSLPSEAQLIDILGISRGSMREALRILEADRFVDVIQGARSGAIVRRPSVDTLVRHTGYLLGSRGVRVNDLYAARQLIEPMLIEWLATHQPAKALSALHRSVRRLRGHLWQDHFAAVQAELSALYEVASGPDAAPVLGVFAQLLFNLSLLHQQHFFARHDVRLDQVRARIAAGIDALDALMLMLEDGDAEGAMAHWRAHLGRQQAYYADAGEGMRVIDLPDG
jgi:DNA-binding FadR family transcriptional regulator